MAVRFWIAVCVWLVLNSALTSANDLGPFADQCGIGSLSAPGPGTAQYDLTSGTLTISGGGANIWATEDNFHYVWKKASGDITLAANLSFPSATPGAIEHRKAVIMVRQTLEPNSPYADACLHGNGMTALQWRESQGDSSNEIQANANAPKRLRIEKRGSYFSMFLGNSEADLHPAGGACKVEISGEYYIGIGICSHSKDRIETATASDIAFGAPSTGSERTTISTLETCSLANHDRKVVYVLDQSGRFEAPNWGADNFLYFNNKGRFYKIKVQLPNSKPPETTIQPEPALVDLGLLTRLNNDHVLSFDKTMLAVSDQSQGNRQSAIWIIPIAGGVAKPVTTLTPSYCHGWSPDGQTLVYAAQRANKWDVYAISSKGGDETRLTNSAGRADGPEYSPDGQYIYFCSDRNGLMQIWRMSPDGSNQEQITSDDSNNWFPHVSPDGQYLSYLSYDKSVASGDHPESKDVVLRIRNLHTGAIATIARLFGGQGTMNVPSWSPDSKYFAFVSYQSVAK